MTEKIPIQNGQHMHTVAAVPTTATTPIISKQIKPVINHKLSINPIH